MTDKEFAKRLEQMVGYPIRPHRGLLKEFEDALEAEEPDGHEDMLGDLAFENVHWAGEFCEGPRAWSDDEDEQQPPCVLVRHFAGLLVFRFDFTGEADGFWLADLNPRSDGLRAPVYHEHRGGVSPRWYIFDNPVRLLEYTDAKDELEGAEAMRDTKAQAKAAERLAQGYPRAVALFSKHFRQLGVKTVAKGDFPDPDSERLFAAYDAFAPIAATLIRRANGKKQAPLSSKDVARCEALAVTDADYPPHVLMAMLAPALSGNMAKATKLAAKVQKTRSATALCRRWAERILEKRPPFDRKS